MTVNSHKSEIPVTSPTHEPAHMTLRFTLIALATLVALTAIGGAIFVVPTIPAEWLHQGLIAPFTDYTIPALALGILCGSSALVALAALVMQRRLGGLASLIAGVIMIGFELVEIVIVGFTPVTYSTQPQGWLQVFYLAVGALMAVLGWQLWRRSRPA